MKENVAVTICNVVIPTLKEVRLLNFFFGFLCFISE
jgi:hypothetical protein